MFESIRLQNVFSRTAQSQAWRNAGASTHWCCIQTMAAPRVDAPAFRQAGFVQYGGGAFGVSFKTLPTDHLARIQVKHQVEVEERTCDRATQPGNVPDPNLIGAMCAVPLGFADRGRCSTSPDGAVSHGPAKFGRSLIRWQYIHLGRPGSGRFVRGACWQTQFGWQLQALWLALLRSMHWQGLGVLFQGVDLA